MANKYAIAVDYRRCIGCGSCAVSCKMENNVPNEVWYCTVNTLGGDSNDAPAGKYGSNTISYQPLRCQHCDTPSCVEVCPVGATYKDEETGIVMQDTDVCIGCKSCIEACPYMAVGAGVRTYIGDTPEFLVGFPVGSGQAPNHKANTVEKCNLCYSRIANGEVPACVEGCPTYACTFGDLNDPESDISKLLAAREYEQILPDSGTGPNMYFL
ncbi:MAG: 4Fe-4S dicluster domain-containing protein [Actinobacteria bacterium]|nr:4Fe-4S dicluster domain-containing protein [Actinomycetota bacterium]